MAVRAPGVEPCDVLGQGGRISPPRLITGALTAGRVRRVSTGAPLH
jgi:hypothetical protein